MALTFLILLTLCSHLASSHLIRRDDGPPNPGSPTVPDPGIIIAPDTAKSPNTFNSNTDPPVTDYPYSSDPIPDFYQPRDIDLPFGWMQHGGLTMFPQGQVSDPTGTMDTDQWTPGVTDYANQSACGIPHNAYNQERVAIHPYWLRYAGLDRYCMPDVCISIWPEDQGPDMIVKVTDICSTDPSDPTHCASPADIKLDRAKVHILYNLGGQEPELKADRFNRGAYWHLTKCWTNALVQPAYADNWFVQPPLPNNFNWDVDSTRSQFENNVKSYPSKNWTVYPNGLEIPTPEMKANITPVSDWVEGQEPAWAPIAGGLGYGTPLRSKGPPPGLYPGKSTRLAAVRDARAPSLERPPRLSVLRRPVRGWGSERPEAFGRQNSETLKLDVQ